MWRAPGQDLEEAGLLPSLHGPLGRALLRCWSRISVSNQGKPSTWAGETGTGREQERVVHLPAVPEAPDRGPNSPLAFASAADRRGRLRGRPQGEQYSALPKAATVA